MKSGIERSWQAFIHATSLCCASVIAGGWDLENQRLTHVGIQRITARPDRACAVVAWFLYSQSQDDGGMPPIPPPSIDLPFADVFLATAGSEDPGTRLRGREAIGGLLQRRLLAVGRAIGRRFLWRANRWEDHSKRTAAVGRAD